MISGMVLKTSGVDVWTFIETAILVASMDYGSELKQRRDGIVERLYATTAPFQSCCQICDEDDGDNSNVGNEAKTTTTKMAMRDDNGNKDLDLYCGLLRSAKVRGQR
nr:putative mediator of rna polymerase ii transcription subunit 26c [Quercus suber]